MELPTITFEKIEGSSFVRIQLSNSQKVFGQIPYQQISLDVADFIKQLQKDNGELKERHFTIDQIEKMRARAYNEGFWAGKEDSTCR